MPAFEFEPNPKTTGVEVFIDSEHPLVLVDITISKPDLAILTHQFIHSRVKSIIFHGGLYIISQTRGDVLLPIADLPELSVGGLSKLSKSLGDNPKKITFRLGMWDPTKGALHLYPETVIADQIADLHDPTDLSLQHGLSEALIHELQHSTQGFDLHDLITDYRISLPLAYGLVGAMTIAASRMLVHPQLETKGVLTVLLGLGLFFYYKDRRLGKGAYLDKHGESGAYKQERDPHLLALARRAIVVSLR